MNEWKKHDLYDDYKSELGSECCDWQLHYENDDIGICGRCKEWTGRWEGDKLDFGEWLAANAQ